MPNSAKSKYKYAGVLCHISSLPSGDLGADAFRFADFLHDIGASIWQTLPLNLPHDDGSPYQCLSAHAGNPAFISLDGLVEMGLLKQQELPALQTNKYKGFGRAYLAFKSLKSTKYKSAYQDFVRHNAGWLHDFASYLVLREKFHHASWNTWPEPYKNRQAAAMAEVKAQYAHEIALIKFTQFLFFFQWHALKTYANQLGIAMFGDIPIFVAYDSADVWAKPQLFKLDTDRNMQVVAGVPPDYFSQTGQRWGNPHYDWQAMKSQRFSWWLARMRTQEKMFDLVRIDHFRGLEAAWEIPANEPTAVNGAWVEAPGDALLQAISSNFPKIKLIAEDLGVITPEVDALRKKYQLPGMKILQFAFGGGDDNPYLPENIEQNSVVYTGTHDNDTTLGWYQQLDTHTKQHVQSKAGSSLTMPQALVYLALETKASTAIIPMQDILGLGAEARMNVPGTADGNWQWRFNWSQLSLEHRNFMRQSIQKTGRANAWR